MTIGIKNSLTIGNALVFRFMMHFKLNDFTTIFSVVVLRANYDRNQILRLIETGEFRLNRRCVSV